MDTPISESNVSLKLSLIQKRCEELMLEGSNDLHLEDVEAEASPGEGGFNPYSRA